jgi:putative cardiolipin synthase
MFLLCFLLIGGCASLEPVDREPEYTAPPAAAAHWDAINAAAPDDWHALLNDGLTALDWRLRAIDSANQSITFQTFLWSFDTTGSMVLDHLIRAADRGVHVRILVDDSFLMHEGNLLLAIAEHPRIEYRVFNPFKRRGGGMATRQLLNLAEFKRLDHRMHNKSMVIDNQVAIVGGRNVADEYFGLNERANFRDLEMIFGGTVVRQISDAFDIYWNDRWSFPIETISHATASAEELAQARRITDEATHVHSEESPDERLEKWLSLAATADTGQATLFFDEPPEGNPKNREEFPIQVANELISLFNGAESEIIIVSAYLIPTPDLEGAVARAVSRGVRVRILTNSIGSNNHLAAHSAYRNHIRTLAEDGAELHEVRTDAKDRDRYMLTPIERKAMALHAKALVIDDDKVFIGSANLDPRSLRINTEMGFLVVSEPFNQTVRSALEGDFSTANAWRLELMDSGDINWVSDDETLTSMPANSLMQRLEDWFFAHVLPEGEL